MDVDVNCSVLSIRYVILHQEAEDPTCQVAPLFLLVGAQWTNGKATLRMWITLQIFGYNCIFTCLRVWGLSRAGAESAAAPQSPTVFIQGARHKCSGLLWLSCEGGAELLPGGILITVMILELLTSAPGGLHGAFHPNQNRLLALRHRLQNAFNRGSRVGLMEARR